jgi:hypothetical protein
MPRDENGDPVIDEVEFNGIVNKFDRSDYKEFKSLGQDGIQRMFVDRIDQNATWLSKILMDKRWAIVFSEDPVFVTSDTPLILENIHQCPFGFSTPGTMLFFPMTPTRILMMDDRTDQPSGRYYPLDQLNPSQTNLLLWRNCERFIISPRRTVFEEMCEYAYRQATDRNG